MADPPVVVYVRNTSLQRVALVEDFQRLELTCRFNGIGSWTLDVDQSLDAAVALSAPGCGIEVSYGGTTLLSGPVTGRKHERDATKNAATISGVSDDVWLARRLASPQPATFYPPYSGLAYDARTGVASTVLRGFVGDNAGPSAIGPRQVPGLTMGTDPAVGVSGTWQGRWQPLPELLDEIAITAGLGYRVAQSGTTLLFSVSQPVDRSGSVRFDLGLGNLAAYTYEAGAPESTYVFVGGSGEGVARVVQEVYDPDAQAMWGRIEKFVDKRDSSVAANLTQAGTDELTQHAEQTSLSITPIDTPQMQFGTHYNLGDKVTAVIDGVSVVDVVREVKLTLTPDGARQLVPTIGTPGPKTIFRLFRDVRNLASRMTNLERR